MLNQTLITLLFFVGFGCIIYMAQYLHKQFSINAEYTRKIAHISATLASLILIYTIDSHWYILFIGLVFFVILFVAKRKNLFKSIDAVNRRTAGSYLLPLSVYIVFYISRTFHNDLIFILPVLLLGISDPLAGLFGTCFRNCTKWITLFNHQFDKTVIGSAIFFCSSFIISLITLYLFDYEFPQVLLLTLFIACTTTVTELLSPYGIDNLTVPLVTVLLLFI
jgi:phytol kinase